MPAAGTLDKVTLRLNATMRLEDAQVLFYNQRYDGAAYICGYAVEFALKARICETLNTATYPDHITGFKIHKLETLLFLTGQENNIKTNASAEWNFVLAVWQPEIRYKAAGSVLAADVQTFLEATKTLLQLL